jgi:drug/metabolite transporter (DMT)-like permease
LGELLAIVAAIFYALGGLMTRKGTDNLRGDQGIMVTVVVNAVLLAVASALSLIRTGVGHLSLKVLLFFAAGGLLGPLLGRSAHVGAVARLGPSRASMYKNAQPLVTTLIALTFMHEPFTYGALAGGAMLMVGIWYLSSEPQKGKAELPWDTDPNARTAGILFGLAAACGYALANVVRKLGMTEWPAALPGAAIGAMAAFVGAALAPGATVRWKGLLTRWHKGHWYFAAFGAATSVAQVAFFSSLAYSPVWLTNVLSATEPLMTILLSMLVFSGKERMSRWVLASGAMIVAGVALLIV